MKYSSILLLVVILLSTSCGQRVPNQMPKTFPCTITVTNGATPIDGADIVLLPDPEIPDTMISGATDVSGKAEIRTMCGSFSKPGAPVGNFRVIVRKDVEVAATKTAAELDAMNPMQLEQYEKQIADAKKKLKSPVPALLGDVTKSPVQFEMTSGLGNLDVDVSKYAQ